MSESHAHIPEPASRFLRAECAECNEIQVVCSHATTQVTCNSCGNEISTPTGAVARLNGRVISSAE